MPGGWIAALLIALTPGTLRWWGGRALLRLLPQTDDAVLPERLAAHNRRFNAVSVGCAALLLVGWPWSAVWSVPLLVAAQATGSFPLRKALYQETWSLGARLSFTARLVAAAFGFWILLTTTPWLASQAGRFDWAAAVGLAGVLVIWNRYSAVILRRLWRTQPITDPAMLGRFQALASACGVPMPRFEYVPMRGGVLANAVAVPSLRGSSVLFTDTLLSRLTEDETTAICAHELAHLEYYDTARLRRLDAVTHLLILGAVAVAPAARLAGTSEFGFIVWLWPCAVVAALVFRAKDKQKNETVSDLRAVALTGNAEALASALATLHAIARVPRRWDQQRERASTHPSLARRIRDIRAAAGIAAATVTPSAGFHAASGTTEVRFDGTQLVWQERAGTTHLLDYGALVELRLHAPASGAITLVAVERQGRRWTMTPRPEDLPAIQKVLDVVDGRLTHEAPARTSLSPVVARMVAILGWTLAAVAGQVAAGFVAVLAAISPGPLLLGSAGMAALAGAALSLRDGALLGRLGVSSVLAVMGVGLLGLAWMRRGESARGERPLVAVLAAFTALSVASVCFGGLSPIRLHQGARSAPGAVVLLVALAAACWTWRTRARFRYAAVASSLGAAVVATLGSAAFLDTVVRDPFVMAAPRATWTRMRGPAIAEFDVPVAVETLRLSPHARLAAVRRMGDYDSGDASPSPGFLIGRPGGPLSQVDASAVAFVDDDRALLLVARDGAAEVRDVSFDNGPIVQWRETVPDIRWSALTYEARTNQWVAVGRDEAGQLVRATGSVRHAGTEITRWAAPADPEGGMETIGTLGRAALIVEKRYSLGPLNRMSLGGLGPLLAAPYTESRLWQLRDGRRLDAGRSLLDASCVSDTLGDPRVVCTAFDGTRTRIVSIDIGTGSVTALTTIDGHFRTGTGGTRGWLTGWSESGPVALRLATREAMQPPVLPVPEYVSMVAASDGIIGTVAWKYRASRIRLYRTE